MPQSPVDALRTQLTPEAQAPDYGYGFRYNSRDPKGLGYLGPLERPDQSGIMGEYSIGVPVGGRQTTIPSIVPTLTREEIQGILASQEGQPPSPAVQQKAAAYAQWRQNAGLPVFALPGEQQDLYPDVPRRAIPEARPQAPPMAVSHESTASLRQKLGR